MSESGVKFKGQLRPLDLHQVDHFAGALWQTVRPCARLQSRLIVHHFQTREHTMPDIPQKSKNSCVATKCRPADIRLPCLGSHCDFQFRPSLTYYRVRQEPNQNRKPKLSEPFCQEPNAEPEPTTETATAAETAKTVKTVTWHCIL